MDPSQIINRSFVSWQAPAAEDPMAFPNPNPNRMPLFLDTGAAAKPARAVWKRKKAGAAGGTARSGGYQPPALSELQFQNRVKARRFYPKKKCPRFAPLAPRNTTSFIIRAKRAGGIASLVSPCPVTPAILPTPKISPSREGLVDMAKEEWGVDGYGSMKGLIRLRPPAAGGAGGEEEDGEGEEGWSSGSDVEEHLEVERRLDHDLSRFEMVYPGGGDSNALESRVDDQDGHITRLEEENLTLKERLFLMEAEMSDLWRRLRLLEAQYRPRGENGVGIENENAGAGESDNGFVAGVREEEVSENDDGGGGDVCSEKSVGGGGGDGGGSTPMRA